MLLDNLSRGSLLFASISCIFNETYTALCIPSQPKLAVSLAAAAAAAAAARNSGFNPRTARIAYEIWGFPTIRGTFLGVPIIRTIAYRGLYWGPLILGNYHLGPFHTFNDWFA